MENNRMPFGTRLKAMRAIRGCTQVQLAEQVDVHPSLIAKIESGKVLPSEELERQIRQALDWDVQTDRAFALMQCETA